ncbi:MAG TPA: hypothetical protein VGO57_10765 [Verrucomicrobiae bacterium]|jgi:hypothetical protein
MTKTTRHPSLLLDFLIIAIGIGLMVLMFRFGPEVGQSATKGIGAILGSIYVIYLGLLFLLSYFFSNAGYVFRGLMFVCESFSRPPERYMALVYFAICMLLGLDLLLLGLGFL